MKHYKWTCLMAAVLAAAVLTGCSGSGSVQEKIAALPAVEIGELRDEVILPDTEGADIELLSLENPIDYSYSTYETDMIFRKQDGVWVDALDKQIPLNQEKFEAMAENFLKLHAVSQVEPAGSLSEYGLSDPPYSVYITDSERGEIYIKIGNQDAAGNYYVTINDNGVYTIKASTVGSMVFEYEQLVVRDTLGLQVTAADIQSVYVSAGGQTAAYSSSDQEAMERIAGGINAVVPLEFASYHALSQELESAELTEEARITFQAAILVDGEEKNLTIYAGTFADPEETLRYVQLGGSDMIMIVSDEVIMDLLNAQKIVEE